MAWATPDAFTFRDYRAFLRAFYELNKRGGYGFSLRAFSKRARLGSSNYLKLVMDGERNLTLGHHVQRFHRVMLERAADANDHVPREDRELECITLCLSEARMHELKARIEAFCDEVMQAFQADTASRRVVQLNVQMFPLTIKES